MNHRRILLLAVSAALLQACSGGNDNQAATDQPSATMEAETAARVFIVSPADGAELNSPITVIFGIEDFGLAPAGTQDANTGHHHLLVDTELPALDQPIPADANHLHFGKAQTETTLELGPGEHTLQLLLGDGNHMPHDTTLISEPVTITITEGPTALE